MARRCKRARHRRTGWNFFESLLLWAAYFLRYEISRSRFWDQFTLARYGAREKYQQDQSPKMTEELWRNHRLRRDIRCLTEGETTEMVFIRACHVQSGPPTNYRIETPNAGKKTIMLREWRSKIIPLVTFYVLVTRLSHKPVQLPKKLVIAYCTGSPTLRAQPSGPSKPMNGKGEVIAVYKPSESKESQMRNHLDITKIDKR